MSRSLAGGLFVEIVIVAMRQQTGTVKLRAGIAIVGLIPEFERVWSCQMVSVSNRPAQTAGFSKCAARTSRKAVVS